MIGGALVVIAPIIGAVALSQHASAVDRLERRVEEIAQAHSLILAPMLDHEGPKGLYDVIGAIVVDPEVVGVAIYDAAGDTLARLGTAAQDEPTTTIVATQPLQIGDRSGLKRLGYLEITATHAALDAALVDQFAVAFGAAVAATAVAAGCAAATYRQMALKPLRKLSDAIAQSRGDSTPHDAPWRSDDEFGAVVDAFNAMQRDRRSFLRDIEQARGRADAAVRAQEALYANATHELRTPLHLIMGFADLLLADIAHRTPEQERAYLQQIRDSSVEMLAYVENVFLAARAQSGALTLDWAETDIGDLLRHAVEAQTRAAAERGGRSTAR